MLRLVAIVAVFCVAYLPALLHAQVCYNQGSGTCVDYFGGTTLQPCGATYCRGEHVDADEDGNPDHENGYYTMTYYCEAFYPEGLVQTATIEYCQSSGGPGSGTFEALRGF